MSMEFGNGSAFVGATSSVYHLTNGDKRDCTLAYAIAQQHGKKRQTMLTQTADAQRLIDEAIERQERKTATRQRQQYEKSSSSWPNTQEKQKHRDKLRAQLKQQCLEKEEERRHQLKACHAESQEAMAIDKACLEEDARERRNKAKRLREFGVGNKELIEQREKDRRAQKQAEQEADRRLLQQSPINWSHTLS